MLTTGNLNESLIPDEDTRGQKREIAGAALLSFLSGDPTRRNLSSGQEAENRSGRKLNPQERPGAKCSVGTQKLTLSSGGRRPLHPRRLNIPVFVFLDRASSRENHVVVGSRHRG